MEFTFAVGCTIFAIILIYLVSTYLANKKKENFEANSNSNKKLTEEQDYDEDDDFTLSSKQLPNTDNYMKVIENLSSDTDISILLNTQNKEAIE